MKIYLAGGENRSWLKAINKAGGNKSLYSYFYLNADNGSKVQNFFEEATQTQTDVFLDSGGYSAWSKGVDIDIKEYCQFIRQNKVALTCYAQLDSIGDEVKTEKNLNIMLKEGVRPLPVFHYRGSLSRLKDLSNDFDYIALGGLVPLARQKEKLKKWLDTCFSVIGRNCKTHGFGMTGGDIICRYPFYSVDSTSWLGGSMRAEVYEFKKGKMVSHSTTKGKKFNRAGVMFKDDDRKLWFDRVVRCAEEWQKMEKYVTRLWEKKGIVYDEK